MQDRNRNSFAWGGGGISIRPTMCLSACMPCPTTRSPAGRRDRNSQPKGFLNSLLGSIGDSSKTIGAPEAIRPNWPVSLIRATATKPNDTRDHVREPLSPAFCVGACAARVGSAQVMRIRSHIIYLFPNESAAASPPAIQGHPASTPVSLPLCLS